MTVFHWLLGAFLLVPLAEIYVLLQVGGIIGALPTIFLVVFTAVVGAVLMRAQGFATVQKVQHQLAAGEIPAVAMLEGAFILLAGALLLTPGFITDFIGFCCLHPPLRRGLIRRMSLRFGPRNTPTGPTRGYTIDADFIRHDDDGRK